MVKVEFFASLRRIVGEKEVSLEAEDIIELLKKLVEKYPKLKEQIFENFEQNKVHSHLRIVVNRCFVRDSEGLNNRLKDGDKVAIFPPTAGG